jgi:hypothetical protein
MRRDVFLVGPPTWFNCMRADELFRYWHETDQPR